MRKLMMLFFVTVISVLFDIFTILASFNLNLNLFDQTGTGVGFYILLFEVNDKVTFSEIPYYTVKYTIIGTSLIVIPLTLSILKIISTITKRK